MPAKNRLLHRALSEIDLRGLHTRSDSVEDYSPQEGETFSKYLRKIYFNCNYFLLKYSLHFNRKSLQFISPLAFFAALQHN